jgi:hypothetical protein
MQEGSREVGFPLPILRGLFLQMALIALSTFRLHEDWRGTEITKLSIHKAS